MKKRSLVGLIFCLILCMVVATTAFGENASSTGTTSTNPHPSLNSIILDKSFANFVESIKPFLNSIKEKQPSGSVLEQSIGSTVIPLSPAPPLTAIFVYAACSEYQPNWVVYNTPNSHSRTSATGQGGSWMNVATLEIGYGQNHLAWMSGRSAPNYQSLPVDLDGDSIVDAFLEAWDVTGLPKGQFTSQATSINYPWNTMSCWFNFL
jgi:hypothetical protein